MCASPASSVRSSSTETSPDVEAIEGYSAFVAKFMNNEHSVHVSEYVKRFGKQVVRSSVWDVR